MRTLCLQWAVALCLTVASGSAYRQAVRRVADAGFEEALRAALLAAQHKDIEPLVRLARQRDRAFRDRAAVVIAILGHPEKAAGLQPVDGPDRFHQHLRRAQWFVQAGLPTAGQEEAWQAVRSAPLSRDRRYALSMLVEAHGVDSSYERLLERFSRQTKLGDDEQQAR